MSDQVFGEDFEDGDDLEFRRSSGGLSGKKLFIIIGVIIILIAAIGAGLFLSGAMDEILAGDKSGPEKEQMHQAAQNTHASGSSSEAPEDGEIQDADIYLTLPDMLVNLQPGDKRQHFMKIKIALELHSNEDKATVEKRIPRVMDHIQSGLRIKSAQELQGSAGFETLKNEMKIRANKALAPIEVKDVLIQELLVQ